MTLTHEACVSVANLAVFLQIWACFLWIRSFFEDLQVADMTPVTFVK